VCLIISATLSNFIRKYYLLHELLISKYWWQNISVSNIASHTAVRQSGVQPTEHVRQWIRFSHETPDFIIPALWPANSTDLNPVDYQIWLKLQDRVYRSHVTATSWSRAWSKSGNISLTSSTRWTFWTDFRCAGVLLFARTHTWQSIMPVPIVDTYAFEWPY